MARFKQFQIHFSHDERKAGRNFNFLANRENPKREKTSVQSIRAKREGKKKFFNKTQYHRPAHMSASTYLHSIKSGISYSFNPLEASSLVLNSKNKVLPPR